MSPAQQQVWLVIGCALLLCGVILMWAGWPRRTAPPRRRKHAARTSEPRRRKPASPPLSLQDAELPPAADHPTTPIPVRRTRPFPGHREHW